MLWTMGYNNAFLAKMSILFRLVNNKSFDYYWDYTCFTCIFLLCMDSTYNVITMWFLMVHKGIS
jgi:hypothetical protein